MLFNSFEFIIFLPIVTLLYFLLAHKLRVYFLLIASCIFYCYFIPIYLLLLVFIIIIDYSAGLQIEKQPKHKKLWLYMSITANVGVLAIFKYYNFVISNFNELFGTSASALKIILPIGLSFHTFQAMAYTIEVYRGKVKAETNISVYALYVLFYPQLVAGPIERPQNLLPQLHKKQIFTSQNLLDGLRLIVWGYFKKLVIADNLSLIVDVIYKSPLQYEWYLVMLSIFLFTIQIYCDFSGYTDIARGAAKLLGYNLMINFNRPLFSTSIRIFWQKWHISLSTWFRDYIYFPLGGNKNALIKQVGLIFLVFIISGFWHGAGWNFIIWGSIHAICLITTTTIFNRFFKIPTIQNPIIVLIKILAVNIIVAYAFVFFRNIDVRHSIDIILQSIRFTNSSTTSTELISQIPVFGNYSLVFLCLFVMLLFVFEALVDPSLFKMNKFPILDAIWFSIIFFTIIFWGVFTKESFIYFQF